MNFALLSIESSFPALTPIFSAWRERNSFMFVSSIATVTDAMCHKTGIQEEEG